GGVGLGVALRHGEVGMTEQHLHIDLARTRFDRPGSKGVTEAMGMNALDRGTFAQAVEDHTEGMRGDHRPEVGGEEERRRYVTAKRSDVVAQGSGGGGTETDPALLLSLAVADEGALALPVDVRVVERHALRGAHAAI